MELKEDFYKFALKRLGYKSRKDLYENLCIKAIVDSYRRISKLQGLENDIRDRFILDLEKENPLTSSLIQNDILQLDFERYHFVSSKEKRRTDIVFFISGIGKFTFECKRLFQKTNKNIYYFNEGLKRFLDLKYAFNENYGGMLGFIISGDILTILNDINNKLKMPPYISKELNLLSQQCVDWTHSFQSKHIRIDNTKIHIYHLFFEFSSEK